MKIVWYEAKKLLSTRMFQIFLILCMLFNLFLITVSTDDTDYNRYVSEIAEETGVTINEDFYNKLDQLQDSSSYDPEFLGQVTSVVDVFDGYDITGVGESYIRTMNIDGTAVAKMINKKYLLMQTVVDEKAEEDVSLSLYLAGNTDRSYWSGVDTVISWLLYEGMFLSVLSILLLSGYERTNATEEYVCSTKSGRNVMKHKWIAGTGVGVITYLLIAVLTLGVYFLVNGYPSILQSNISSVFHTFSDQIGSRPFVTWGNFSVLGYYLLSVGLSSVLMICFGLMGYIVGCFFRNTYIGFFAVVIANGFFYLGATHLPRGTIITYLFDLFPINLAFNSGVWFTDGGVTIWPYFETIGVLCSLVFLGWFSMISTWHYKKRDLI